MKHPLEIGTLIKANVSVCTVCNGGVASKPIEGIILKVIERPNGIWYYLDVGRTVNANQVLKILKKA